MKPKTTMSVLGWAAAVLLNIGALLFIVGLVLPHGDGPGGVLVVGIALLVVGAVIGAAWLLCIAPRVTPRPVRSVSARALVRVVGNEVGVGGMLGRIEIGRRRLRLFGLTG